MRHSQIGNPAKVMGSKLNSGCQILSHLLELKLDSPDLGQIVIQPGAKTGEIDKTVFTFHIIARRGVVHYNSQGAVPAEQKFVAIVVQDTNADISPENMSWLFEPVFTTKPKGIGLGLVVSKKLTEAASRSRVSRAKTVSLRSICRSQRR